MYNIKGNKKAIIELINQFILQEPADQETKLDQLLKAFDQEQEIVKQQLKWFRN